MLGELEQIVLLAIVRVGDDAYGVAVREEIARRTGRDITLGTLYKGLQRLQDKGLVSSRTGEPTAERGGRAKRYYAVTAAGHRDLQQSLKAIRRMTAGLGARLETP